MESKLTLKSCLLAGAVCLAGAAPALASECANARGHADARSSSIAKDHHAAPRDIVDTAAAAGDFTTLVTAVDAAGLVEALRGDGPFTVFAPNDAAFALLPDGTVDMLVEPENRAQLQSVLTFHVAPGRYEAADLARLSALETLNGERLSIDAADGVRIETAQVIAADIEAANGVIHVIDRVLSPTAPVEDAH